MVYRTVVWSILLGPDMRVSGSYSAVGSDNELRFIAAIQAKGKVE